MIRKVTALLGAAVLFAAAPAQAKPVGEFNVELNDGVCSASTAGDNGMFMIFAPDDKTGGSFGFTVQGQSGLPEGMVPIQLGIGTERFEFTASYSNNAGGFGVYIIPMDSKNAQELLGGFPDTWPFEAYRDNKRIFGALVTPSLTITSELEACRTSGGRYR